MTIEGLEVEARFSAEGEITVLSLTWRGQKLPVAGQRRQWHAEDGRHFWLLTVDERLFEGAFEPERGQWRVVQAPPGGWLA